MGGERGGDDGLAHVGIGAGDDQSGGMAGGRFHGSAMAAPGARVDSLPAGLSRALGSRRFFFIGGNAAGLGIGIEGFDEAGGVAVEHR